MTDLRTKLGALLVKPALKTTLKSFDASEYGGAPLLGLKGLVVKTHGSAKAIEVEHSIDQCVQFKQQHISEKIEKAIHKKMRCNKERCNDGIRKIEEYYRRSIKRGGR